MPEQLFNNKEAEILKGTRKTSFFLGLMSGVAAASTLALIGLFILIFSGQSVVRGGAVGNNNIANNNVANTNNNQPTDSPEPLPMAEVPPVTDGDRVKGSANAQVTLIEYSDFECPFCARHAETMKEIAKTYGDKVRIVFRHFPLSFHPNAQKASEAAECAGDQGKFWEMYEKIFEANQNKTMSVDKWKEEAKSLGLNTKKFNECLDSGKYASKVQSDMAGGSAAGVEGTPATFVNGELISGALPFEQFKQIIDSKL